MKKQRSVKLSKRSWYGCSRLQEF